MKYVFFFLIRGEGGKLIRKKKARERTDGKARGEKTRKREKENNEEEEIEEDKTRNRKKRKRRKKIRGTQSHSPHIVALTLLILTTLTNSVK